MKKVFWFHGLGGTHEEEVREILKNYKVDFFNPSMDYELNRNNPKFIKYIMEIAKDYDYIIGNSMGGFWAFHVGTLLGKKTILFNPAISEITLSYKWFYKDFFKVNKELTKELKEKTDVTLFISTDDTVVNYDKTFEWLNNMGYKYNFEWLKNETHSLDFNLIFKKIFTCIY